MRMTRSERTILSILTVRGRTLSSELPNHTNLAPRTVNFAVRKLLDKKLIKKIPNLNDMRTVFYEPVTFIPNSQSAVQTISAEANI
jgi:DNA-binding MarR family transcriptional regulator